MILYHKIRNSVSTDTVFLQNGAPCHFALHVKPFLNLEFLQWWIKRGGPFSWPPHLPEFTLLDFFMETCKNNSERNQT